MASGKYNIPDNFEEEVEKKTVRQVNKRVEIKKNPKNPFNKTVKLKGDVKGRKS